MSHARRLGGLAALLSLGCSGPVDVSLSVASSGAAGCPGSLDSFENVSRIAIDAVPSQGERQSLGTFAVANLPRSVSVPAGLVGSDVVIEARGSNASSTVISVGRSLPLRIERASAEAAAPAANLMLRRVNVFSRALGSGGCATLPTARAGHTATALPDGTVLLAGGYRLDGVGRVALSDTQLFDPTSGSLTAGPKMEFPTVQLVLPRAFHAAARLSTGRVLIHGGELYNTDAANTAMPQDTALIYDPPSRQFGAVAPRAAPDDIPRSRHLAIADAQGRVLIAGGVTRRNGVLEPVPEVEWYDPQTQSVQVVPNVSLPRTDLSGAAIDDGAAIALAGGANGPLVQGSVDVFRFGNGTFVQATSSLRLMTPRRAAAAFARGADLVLVGGYSSALLPGALNTTEVLLTTNQSAGVGPAGAKRGGACAAVWSTGALVVGGSDLGTSDAPVTSGAVDEFTWNTDGRFELQTRETMLPRAEATCTTLHDGSVLVAGGIDHRDGQPLLRDDLWVFMPAP